jgi:uncharacterized damage-inducible protein DinB
MDPAEHIRALVAYERWANERVLATAAGLSSEDVEYAGAGGVSSIRATLAHIVGAQGTWLTRWTEGRAGIVGDTGTIGALRREFARSHDELEAFARGLQAVDCERVQVYTDSRGDEHRDTLGTQIVHAINHGTYHRGELSVLLAQVGASPGDLDYLIFSRLNRSQADET